MHALRNAWRNALKPQDIVLVLLFAAMAALNPTHDPWEIGMIVTLGVLQIAESRIGVLDSTRGRILWIVLKLGVGYLLIGLTHGLNSEYYLILLLPVVSAATYLGVFGTLLFTVLACGSYLSFILFVDWTKFHIDADQLRVLTLRLIFLAVAANLVNTLAEALRVQYSKYKSVAGELVEANRNLGEAEAAMRRSERLAALGQLSAGLAHELRNPLGTIRASAEMLTRGVSRENEVAREVAGFISSEVDRTNSLVTRFLDFARPLHLRLAPTDPAQVIDRAVALIDRDPAKYPVTVYRNYSPDLRPFPMDAEFMERVFYNLLLNAVQATEPGGAVTVKTRVVNQTAEIAVIDRGSGIDPAIKETIFNPFVTTKPAGVGLGLAIVSKIVDEHGGNITVESEPGKGSVFRVHLPIPETE
ncbi:MAG: ATP-binding protein [Acidobacteriota bacterium]|nr:ATP-binding protein [Acidobacteriota bacterium]